MSDGWRLHGGYDLLREHVWVRAGRFDFFNALDETADPEQQFSLRSSWDLPGRIEVDAIGRWVDRLVVDSGGKPATVPSYSELDLRVGWFLSRSVELSIVGQNLLHDHHAEFGPGPIREEIERTWYGKVAVRF